MGHCTILSEKLVCIFQAPGLALVVEGLGTVPGVVEGTWCFICLYSPPNPLQHDH